MKTNYNLIGSLESNPEVGSPAVIIVDGKKVKTSPVIHFICKDKETWIKTKHSSYTVTAEESVNKVVRSVVGTLLTPVTNGASAVIEEGSNIRRTSPVMSCEVGPLVSKVETMNTIYFVWGCNGASSFR